jgi:hypothetical protein
MMYLQASRPQPTSISPFAPRLRWEELIGRHYCPWLVSKINEVGHTMSYDAVVTYLREARPRGQEQSYEGSVFWRDWKNRSALLYGLLARPGTVDAFACGDNGIGLPKSKIYRYIERWEIPYLCLKPAPRIVAHVGLRELRGALLHHNGIYSIRTATYVHQVRFTAYQQWVAVHDVGLEYPESVAMKALELAGISASFLDLQLYCTHVYETPPKDRFVKTIPAVVISDIAGHDALDAALRLANRCGCIYWDDARSTCGLDNEVSNHCEDYEPLD